VLVASAWQAAGVRLFNLDYQLAEWEGSRHTCRAALARAAVAEACEGRDFISKISSPWPMHAKVEAADPGHGQSVKTWGQERHARATDGTEQHVLDHHVADCR
jgi:hypothetical protein